MKACPVRITIAGALPTAASRRCNGSAPEPSRASTTPAAAPVNCDSGADGDNAPPATPGAPAGIPIAEVDIPRADDLAANSILSVAEAASPEGGEESRPHALSAQTIMTSNCGAFISNSVDVSGETSAESGLTHQQALSCGWQAPCQQHLVPGRLYLSFIQV